MVATFHAGVVALREGDAEGFRRGMREAGRADVGEYRVDRNVFLSRLWCREFHLAREMARNGG
jgi:hypothetical protein